MSLDDLFISYAQHNSLNKYHDFFMTTYLMIPLCSPKITFLSFYFWYLKVLVANSINITVPTVWILILFYFNLGNT